MIDNLLFLAPPIVSCIILAGVLGYFGNHILSRGLIFIDIAVAQVAALGTMVGILLGFAENSAKTQLISYCFTILIMGVFSFMRIRNQVLPQEAIIGIFYCIALGMALLLVEKIPGGSNYITKTITGNVLWVTWKNILFYTLLFVPIIIIHIVFGNKIKQVTLKHNLKDVNMNVIRLYDLIFYVTFGIVIVKAVPVLGIFLVFILLIAPASIVSIFTEGWKKRIIWSWVIGSLGSIFGIYLSYSINISNGPAIVCLLGVAAYTVAFVKLLKKQPEKIN